MATDFEIVELLNPIQMTLTGGLTYQGDWSGLTAYVLGDVVSHNGSSYVALGNTTNNEPPNSS